MSNTTLIIIAAVVILIVGLIVFLNRKQSVSLQPPASATPVARANRDEPAKEGHGLVDSATAAVLDVSGPLMGIDAHPDLPSDELTRIKGLGPKAATALNGLGIHRYAQLAELDSARVTELDNRMGAFRGRIHRDRWVDQARLLEQGDIAGFETEFGKIG